MTYSRNHGPIYIEDPMIKSTVERHWEKTREDQEPHREEEPALEASSAQETALTVGRGEEPEEGRLQD